MPKNGPIVVIDDDPEDHYILKDALSTIAADQPLTFFDNGHDFLQYLKTTREQPFLILCDINMPGMNGIELRDTIISDPFLREKSIPFVFYSTAANPSQVKTAFELTVQGFFQKPSTFGELTNVMRLIIDYWKVCRHPNDFRT